MQAIRVRQTGGPEALGLETLPDPAPGPGQARVRVDAAGVNFIDVYQRTGLYPMPLPFTPGQEGAGVVEAVGDGVAGVRPGDRVAWVGAFGAYAQRALVPAERLVPLPEDVSARVAAAALLQGMTAHYLACSTRPLGPGDTCLVHAAAGGVGLLLCQVARRRGARVLGTASTPAKAALAREAGAEEVVLYRGRDFAAEVRRLTGDRGVQVVYDSVGRDTWEGSLAALAPRGMLVLFGQSSGTVPAVDPLRLMPGSLFLTRPTLWSYVATRDELLARAGELFAWVRDGSVRVRIAAELALRDAAEAHRRLEGRDTSGKLVLDPAA